MAEEKRCTQCGTVLAPDAPQGLCPACLLKRGLESGSAPGESAPPPTPADLARYFPELEILRLIGRGGMGAVYKARQKNLDRLVALKVLPASVKRDPAFAERFSREAKALARLAHPNIVNIHEFGQKDGLFYFVMEFVDGMNLRQLLNTGRIAPKEALAIVPQICDALQYAHDKGIVHRDIKPENILLDKAGTVKIADFGLAKLVGLEAKDLRITGSGDVMGTPLYMAPEQVEHPQDVDHRADIYSLGVVFYQMLTGELPIGRFAPPSRKVQIDVRLDEVVLRALEKEPELRYQHASEVKTQVETILTSPGSASVPASAVKRQTQKSSLVTERDGERVIDWPAVLRLTGFLFVIMAAVVSLIWLATGRTFRLAQSLLQTFICVAVWVGASAAATRYFCRREGESPVTSRLSRAAIAGACCILLLPATFVGFRVVDRSVINFNPTSSQAFGLVTLGLIGFVELVGPTILGCLALTQIRRSAGKLYGLGLALVDALVFPLLALDCGIVYATFVVAGALLDWPQNYNQPPGPSLASLVGWILAIVADVLIVLWAYRAARKPVGGSRMPPSVLTAAVPPLNEQTHSKVFAYLALGLFLVGLLGTILLLGIFHNDALPFIFGGAALVSALVFGAISWQGRLGKGIVISTLVLFAAIGIAVALLSGVIPDPFRARRRALAEEQLREETAKRIAANMMFGQQVLSEFDWPKLAAEGRVLGGVPVTVDGRTALKIENTNDAPLQLSLFAIENPPITAMKYVVTGEIKYENVQGDGYLEMWNDFAAAGRFFTRTLAPAGQGPIGQISGTSSWRAFALPFDHTGTAGAPTRLEVNIFLPGRGVVFLGSVKLMQSANALSATTWSLPGRLSPFTEVVCHGDNVKVRFEGQEYELVSINDLTSKQILDYCRREFADRWEMRFAEDLVEVLAGMGRPMASDQTVKLELRAAGDGRALTVERALMTHENRHAVMKLVQNGPATGPKATSRTFSLRHRLASDMVDDLRQILLGHPGQEAKPAADNIQLTVTAPPDVLNRVATFVAVHDWPQRITRGPECVYARDSVENAARSFFYACSIEDFYCISNLLSVDLLARLKGAKLPPFGSAVDSKLIDELRADWPGKEAAMRKLIEAWNKYPLRQLREEPGIAMGFGRRYFASASFEDAPQEFVRLSFTHDRNGTYTNALVIDTLPPWLAAK